MCAGGPRKKPSLCEVLTKLLCQGYWACLLFVVQRSSVGGERGVVVLDELLKEVLDEV